MKQITPPKRYCSKLHQLCKLIPSHLTEKLARKYGLDKKSRSATPRTPYAGSCGRPCYFTSCSDSSPSKVSGRTVLPGLYHRSGRGLGSLRTLRTRRLLWDSTTPISHLRTPSSRLSAGVCSVILWDSTSLIRLFRPAFEFRHLTAIPIHHPLILRLAYQSQVLWDDREIKR
jgi:hypothetical protein